MPAFWLGTLDSHKTGKRWTIQAYTLDMSFGRSNGTRNEHQYAKGRVEMHGQSWSQNLKGETLERLGVEIRSL
jgi:hypothetical protein